MPDKNIKYEKVNIWDYIYSEYGKLYSTNPSKSSRIFLELYGNYLKEKEKNTVFIELGCGYGRDIVYIYKNTSFYLYIGIDVSYVMNDILECAQDNLVTIKANLLKSKDLYEIKNLLDRYFSCNFVIYTNHFFQLLTDVQDVLKLVYFFRGISEKKVYFHINEYHYLNLYHRNFKIYNRKKRIAYICYDSVKYRIAVRSIKEYLKVLEKAKIHCIIGKIFKEYEDINKDKILNYNLSLFAGG